MGRVIHFGVVPVDRFIGAFDVPVILGLLSRAAKRDDLARGFVTDCDSFTEWGESLREADERPDALHVLHVTDCDDFDGDGERIRLSREEVQEVARCLDDALSSEPLYRVVDYWLEDDLEVWGSDVHTYGPFALETGPARLTY